MFRLTARPAFTLGLFNVHSPAGRCAYSAISRSLAMKHSTKPIGQPESSPIISQEGTASSVQTPKRRHRTKSRIAHLEAATPLIQQHEPQNNLKSNTGYLNVIKRDDPASYEIAYSKLTREEAQQRLGFLLDDFETQAISVNQMLAESQSKHDGLGNDEMMHIKDKVYERIVEFLICEGFPTESTEDFKESNINDLVYTIISPMIGAFRRRMGRKLRLRREKKITTVDGKMGGFQEFVTVDMIGVGNQIFVFVVEAKKSSLGEAKIQCLLPMKDMRANNGGGVIYGFVTTGQQWQMVRYDGKDYTQTDTFDVLFHTMGEDKQRWMEESAIVLDCIHAALVTGGLANEH